MNAKYRLITGSAIIAVFAMMNLGQGVDWVSAASDSTPIVTPKKNIKKVVKSKKKKITKLSTYQRALVDIKKWRYAEAELALQKVVAKNPDKADAWNWLGYALRKQGKYEESYSAYQKALSIDANHVGAHEYLGELYLQTDRMKEAQKQYRILRRLCPKGCEQLDDLEIAIVEITIQDYNKDQIKAIQTALKKKGFYQASIDGDFGKGSRRALRNFQESNNITTVGILPETRTALGL